MDQNFLTLQFNAESENYAPISALNDLVFCKRRCAYHRLENIWVDSSHTIHGSFLHKKVHAKGSNVKHDRDAFRSLRVLSHKYKLQGICDLVEFVRSQKGMEIFPIEYKRGKKKSWDNDNVQLCAQALCLEEMLNTQITKGFIYHIQSKSRREVLFDIALRNKTILASSELNLLLKQNYLPPPIIHPHCKKCSLKNHCLPGLQESNKHYSVALNNLFVP